MLKPAPPARVLDGYAAALGARGSEMQQPAKQFALFLLVLFHSRRFERVVSRWCTGSSTCLACRTGWPPRAFLMLAISGGIWF